MVKQFINFYDAKVSAFNHSLHYGGSAFEGIRSYDGKIFKLKDHLLRLFHSSNILGIKIPYSIDELYDVTYRLLQMNDLKDSYIRPFVFKTSENLRINLGNNFNTNLLIGLWEMNKYFAANSSTAINIAISNMIKPSNSSYIPYSTKISGLYSINQIIKNNIDEYYDDALIMDDRGYATELTTSNIFIVKNNTLLTPIVDCFLNGITRQTVIKIANENQIQIKECRLTIDDIMSADEMFATGTAVEIMPISSINRTKIFTKSEMTQIIIDLYEKEIKNYHTEILVNKDIEKKIK